MRAGQPELVAQEVDEQEPGVDVPYVVGPVDAEADDAHVLLLERGVVEVVKNLGHFAACHPLFTTPPLGFLLEGPHREARTPALSRERLGIAMRPRITERG